MDLLSTDRTVIKGIKETDGQDVQDLYLNPMVRRYLGGSRKTDAIPAIIEAMLHSDEMSLYLVVREKDTNDFIGLVSLDPHHDRKEFEISYQLLPQWWRKGFGTEIVKEILFYAFHELNLRKVIAETQTANVYSCRLLESTGMRLEKIVKRYGAEQSIYSLRANRPGFRKE